MSLVAGYSSESDSDSAGNLNGSTVENYKLTSSSSDARGRGHSANELNTDAENVKVKRGHNGHEELIHVDKRRKRKGKGPWASWSSSEEDEEDASADQASLERKASTTDTIYREQDIEIQEPDDDSSTILEKSSFYGTSVVDYQGRGFLHPPMDVNVDFTKDQLSSRNYLPKRLIHTYQGHQNGTNVVQTLPRTGHLFLSGGNDNKIKIWDMYHDRQLLRDYSGHTKAVRDVNFNKDGSEFVSVSFDQQMKIWDTETGKVKHRYKFASTPNCAEFRPSDSSELIVGLSNNEIRHYDLRIPHKQGLVQIYDHHLSAIIALKYFPDGSKLISSSEDKTMRIWENQVNIPIKQISDTAQYSMPYIDIHPEHNYFASQSMDNAIYVFSMKPKYKRHPKKRFEGHKCAGFGIGFGFSPDGQFISSGDTQGRVFIWDWKTTRLLKQLEVPDKKAIVTVAWAPQETSKMLCAGNGEKIYLYD
ncbi:LANO_0H22408g1_1 [Lachancea nothofagi CBS 11611]|uniref:Pre-mRNA-processing factor 17 n=1 Tax=Lachancea nothofagi CBS 11611 TaxID=1266666 RepID=A0A1G4KNH7_9SACH|nr:LANO_0H22408g1_1 [Lachancea nothofagi CBS 11611]